MTPVTLRVTQQYIEVLCLTPTTNDASDTLSLTESAPVNTVLNVSASDTLSLGETAALTIYAASDTLTLTESAEGHGTQHLAATDALTLGESAVGHGTQHVAATDTLTLTEGAAGGKIKYASAVDNLVLSDQAGGGELFGPAEDDLQSVAVIYNPTTGQWDTTYLGLSDEAIASIVHGTPFAAADVLPLSEQARGVLIRPGAIDASASDTLSLTEQASVSQWPYYRTPTAGVDVLILLETASAVLVKPAQDTLTLTDAATVSVVRNLAATDTLALGEAVAFVLESRANLFQYHPFIGTGVPGAPTPPPGSVAYDPSLGAPVNTFFYPADATITDSITLRSPELGNKDRLQFNRISRETRGGTLVVYADPIWPKVQVQVLTFTGLVESQASGLLDFLAAHLGEEVGWIDWEQRRWRGIITNPTDAVVQDGREMYTANVELEGALAT